MPSSLLAIYCCGTLLVLHITRLFRWYRLSHDLYSTARVTKWVCLISPKCWRTERRERTKIQHSDDHRPYLDCIPQCKSIPALFTEFRCLVNGGDYHQNTKPRDLAELVSKLPQETAKGKLHFLHKSSFRILTAKVDILTFQWQKSSREASDLPLLLFLSGMCIYPGVLLYSGSEQPPFSATLV